MILHGIPSTLPSYILTTLSLGVRRSPPFRGLLTSGAMPSLETLQDDWKHLYRERLPSLAKKKDPSQRKWSVQLDHCFARIILDNAIGKDRPWNQVIKSPAYRNMTRTQLEDAIALGERLVKGEEDLVVLDERSLALRGKRSKEQRNRASSSTSTKRKADPEDSGKFGTEGKAGTKKRKI